MRKKNQSKLSETKRVGKFGLIGIINTVIDFAIYNFMISVVGFGVIAANVVSVTFAMTFSFFANKRFVFSNDSKNVARQAILFLGFTAFGLYIIQNAIIFSFTELWTWPLQLGYSIVKSLGLGDVFSQEFVYNNGAKAAGIAFTMVWNYLTYKKLVFKK